MIALRSNRLANQAGGLPSRKSPRKLAARVQLCSHSFSLFERFESSVNGALECEPTHWLRIAVLLTAFPGQRDQGYTDDNGRSHAQQFSSSDQIAECLQRHKRGVGKARPCRESNQAAIRRWVTRCQQQENAECDIRLSIIANAGSCRTNIVKG